MSGWALAIDFGTSNTVAVIRRPDDTVEPLLFDGAPFLPSAVYATPDGDLLTGRDALYSARLMPERFEPNPKLRIDDGTLLLGVDVPVERAYAAVLARVAGEAHASGAGSDLSVVLTHPASWGPTRCRLLRSAASAAGLGTVRLESEPTAAARMAASGSTADDGPAVVYDLGGGTFDVSVLARGRVLASDGLRDAGGLDIDAAIIAYLGASQTRQADVWRRLAEPATAADRRAARQFRDDVRTAKEILSRTAQTFLHLPLLDVDVPLGREQLEAVAAPLITRTVNVTRAAMTAAGVPVPLPGKLILVGGGSRMPLVATLLHRHLGTAPRLAEQPELVVARGALHTIAPRTGNRPMATVTQPPATPIVADPDAQRPAPMVDSRRSDPATALPIVPVSTGAGSTTDTASGAAVGHPWYRRYRRRLLLAGAGIVAAAVLVTVLVIAQRPHTPAVIATIAVGANPDAVAVDATKHTAYVMNVNDGTGDGTVSVIDTTTNKVTKTISSTGDGDVAVDPANHRVYVTNSFDSGVLTLDGATTIHAGFEPNGIGVDPTNNRLYVTSAGQPDNTTVTNDNGTVSVIDTTTNKATTTIHVGHNSSDVAVDPANHTAYVTNPGDGTVSVINTTTNKVTRTLSVGTAQGHQAHWASVAVDPTNNLAYATSWVDDTVSVIDTTTNAVISTITVGHHPHGVAVDPANHIAYVTNTGDSTVSVIDTTTNTVTATINASTPSDVAVDTTSHTAYVLDSPKGRNGTVSVIGTGS